MDKQIKVVKIIDDKSLIINAGSCDDLKKGDTVEVYHPGVEVFDPESNESLGVLNYLKATLEVTNIMPKMAECKNVVVEHAPRFPSLDMFAPIDVTRVRTLNIDPLDISGGFEGIDRKIRIGDLVRVVEE